MYDGILERSGELAKQLTRLAPVGSSLFIDRDDVVKVDGWRGFDGGYRYVLRIPDSPMLAYRLVADMVTALIDDSSLHTRAGSLAKVVERYLEKAVLAVSR